VENILKNVDFNKTEAIDFSEFCYANFDYNKNLSQKNIQ